MGPSRYNNGLDGSYIPCCVILGGVAIKALKNYEEQRREGKEPVFHAKAIGIDPEDLDYWE